MTDPHYKLVIKPKAFHMSRLPEKIGLYAACASDAWFVGDAGCRAFENFDHKGEFFPLFELPLYTDTATSRAAQAGTPGIAALSFYFGIIMNKLIFFLLATCASLAATAAPETYVIDGSHTYPRFEYSHFGFSTQIGRFDKTSGTIVLDRARKTGSVDVSIDTTSVNTGFSVFNGHIQGEEFFDTKKYPTITFKSTALQFAGDRLRSLDGNLTIKGVTKPVTLDVTSFHCMVHPMLKKDACGANAVAKIKRTDFNNGTHAPYVGDEVTLTIAVEAIKQ
jgi:polyisoprenoid-binding protein YceI